VGKKILLAKGINLHDLQQKETEERMQRAHQKRGQPCRVKWKAMGSKKTGGRRAESSFGKKSIRNGVSAEGE